ncbi:MAG TPA: succinate dehydrogenase cytochrome b subunit [Gemmataceae bacterium]|nr:succinate dehydrogenase cytochrome b subunit [Gemmataceae bacterium]
MFRSSIGRKALMAVTGLGLLGFVIVHMIGNFQVYEGPDALNAYAKMLREMPALLWVARLTLLLLFVAHIYLGITLYRENRAARPVGYVRFQYDQATIATRTMLLSGLVILAFVIFHLLHFTLGAVQPENFAGRHHFDHLGRPDVYAMVVRGFRNPVITISYVVAQLFLGLHLYHAVPSMFQSVGLKHPRYNPLIEKLGLIVALIIVIGNISMPLSILFGIIGT